MASGRDEEALLRAILTSRGQTGALAQHPDKSGIDVHVAFDVGRAVLGPAVGMAAASWYQQNVQQIAHDIKKSVEMSDYYAPLVFGRLWKDVQEHWESIVGMILAFASFEAGAALLIATPYPAARVIGLAIQYALLAYFIQASALDIVQATAETVHWLLLCREANGKPKELAEASKAFCRVLVHLITALLNLALAKGLGGLTGLVSRKLLETAGGPKADVVGEPASWKRGAGERENAKGDALGNGGGTPAEPAPRGESAQTTPAGKAGEASTESVEPRGGGRKAHEALREQHSIVAYVRSVADGERLLRRLAAGDEAAVAELGIDLKGAKSSDLEWALGKQWDGKVVVVAGARQHVDWGKLPHIEPVAHSHPATPENRLVGKEGTGLVSLDEVLTDRSLRADRLHLLPSPGDLAFLSARGIQDHRVVTPFRYRGEGKLGNATIGDAAPVVEFVVSKPSYEGRWSLNPNFAVYKAEIVPMADGKPIGETFTVHGLDAGNFSAMRRGEIPVAKNDGRGPPLPRVTTEAGRDGKLTKPSGDPSEIAEPRGPRTKIDANDDPATRRGLERENETAVALAKAGYDVEQNPNVEGKRNPDLRIEGKVFDVYSPDYGTRLRNIFSTVRDKVVDEQARRIVINLDDSRARRPRLQDEFRRRKGEVPTLEEVLVVKNGSVFRIYP